MRGKWVGWERGTGERAGFEWEQEGGERGLVYGLEDLERRGLLIYICVHTHTHTHTHTCMLLPMRENLSKCART